MIDGYLMALSHCVPRQRIVDSYHRVIGPLLGVFGRRRIERRVYSVPDPNVLWHHNGQHGRSLYPIYNKKHLANKDLGLQRYGIIIHAFIDGYLCLVLGLRAHSNNLAKTVLQLFEDITNEFGFPSRVRADHGMENLLVAAAMEAVQGPNRGSYIWGKLVSLGSAELSITHVQ
jgi:hypothetical protein